MQGSPASPEPDRTRSIDPAAAPAAAALVDADDTTLLNALLTGQPEAPGVLWQRYAPMVFRILRRTLGPDDDVEDLAQEVFLCVFRKAHTLRDPCVLKAFVIRVAVFARRRELRRRWIRRRTRRVVEAVSPELETVSRHTDAREALLRFYRVLGCVRATDRAALVLRYMESMDLVTVASTLGVSLATAKRRIARGWTKVEVLVERDPFLAQYRSGLASPER
jgi:RNA polymerase sigma-70 factor (ECF subfamily)